MFQELKEQTQECHAQNKDLASQTVGGIRTVRSFHAEKDELRRYGVALDELCAIKRRSGIYSAVHLLIRRVRLVLPVQITQINHSVNNPSLCSYIQMVSLVIKTIMLIQARSLISSGQLSVGSLVSFLLYQKPMSVNLKVSSHKYLTGFNSYKMIFIDGGFFFSPQEIMYCYGETVSTVGVISKVLSYLDRTPKRQKEGDLAPERLEGRIVFQNVTFSYPSSDKPALKVTLNTQFLS